MFQSGHHSYEQDTAGNENRYREDNWRYVQADYAKIPAKPTLDDEPSYEGIPYGLHDTLQSRWRDNDLRRYAWWSVFSGGCGFTYCNNSVMQFYTTGNKPGAYGARDPWTHAIDDPGACQMINLKNLLIKYHFETLIPDQSVLVEPGERYNHLVALKGKTCLLIYTYIGRPIKLNMQVLSGNQFKYKWFCPRTGKFFDAGMFRKDEMRMFDPPGIQENGNDWVLVIERI
jgi:hypothetical protein